MDFQKINTVAVVGASDNPEKASHRVAKYLKENGYRVIPINPTADSVLGEKCYSQLSDIPAETEIDVLDIFRKPEAVLPIVEEAAARGNIKVIWMQEGIINQEAAEKAEKAGMKVVMDKCMLKEHQKYKFNL